MIFANLTFGRIVIHEVFTRDDDRNIVQPRYGEKLVSLSVKAQSELKSRVITAMGRASQSIEMEIQRTDEGSMFALGMHLLDASDDEFAQTSRLAADQLASAQMSRKIPGGILVVFSAEVDHPSKRLLGFIKAEPQSGFTRVQQKGALDLRFIEDLILTPQAKLYKIGVFVEMDKPGASTASPADRFRAFIYDDGMTTAKREAAAQYFYDGFLGCSFPRSSSRLTKHFYEFTREFIRDLSIPEEDKSDLFTGLYTYLKVDQTQTIHVAAFGQSYLTDDHMRDAYEAFMASRDFPTNAVRKDLTEVEKRLRQRKIRFCSNIQITGPAERFHELVEIESADRAGQEAVDGANAEQFTRITIRDRIASQE